MFKLVFYFGFEMARSEHKLYLQMILEYIWIIGSIADSRANTESGIITWSGRNKMNTLSYLFQTIPVDLKNVKNDKMTKKMS